MESVCYLMLRKQFFKSKIRIWNLIGAVVLAPLVVFTQTSSAAIITSSGYTHDDTTDIVVGGGLEWLQWDRTVGLSINDANALLDTIEGGGWAIASNQQMADLFNAFEFGLVFDSDENTYQFTSTGIQAGTESGTDLVFISMFGDTYAAAGLSNNFGEGGFQASIALFGNDPDNDNLFNLAQVDDDYAYSTGTIKDGTVRLYDDRWQGDFSLPEYGVALVRPLSAVPEPTLLMLFAAGLLGVGIVRREFRR